MSRWIVSFSALIVVASAFANPTNGSLTNLSHSGWDSYSNSGTNYGNSYSNTDPKNCDPKPPTNCVPEPSSIAALAIGGIAFLRRKKKAQA